MRRVIVLAITASLLSILLLTTGTTAAPMCVVSPYNGKTFCLAPVQPSQVP